jgi:RHH-type proline utilization regulon transcriptional repressor/proline dehydrogenase/delta 1-pyrroline-5-carboxylate dehydrogenase
VGRHKELLPYLVRRLLENGANTSFVNRIADVSIPVDDIVADPVERVRSRGAAPNPMLPLPRELFAPERVNSRGLSLADQPAMTALDHAFATRADTVWMAVPIVEGERVAGTALRVVEPANASKVLGDVVVAGVHDIDRAIERGTRAQPAWDAIGGEARAAILDRAATQIETALDEWVVLLAREAGKARADAIGEVREAADFAAITPHSRDASSRSR